MVTIFVNIYFSDFIIYKVFLMIKGNLRVSCCVISKIQSSQFCVMLTRLVPCFCLHMLNLQVKIVKAYLSILRFILSKKKQFLTLHIHCRSKTVIFTFNGQNTNNSFVYIIKYCSLCNSLPS